MFLCYFVSKRGSNKVSLEKVSITNDETNKREEEEGEKRCELETQSYAMGGGIDRSDAIRFPDIH